MQNVTFRVFKYRNFRLFFPGLIISQIGIWVQSVAINWLVYNLTNSALLTGISLFISHLPLLFFTLIAGGIIDKLNKHRLLITIQYLFLLQSFILCVLFCFKAINIFNIIALGFFMNILLAMDGPLRQSLFVYLVKDKKDLTNAISINSSCFNIVKTLGPSISGLIITYLGYGMCFFVNFLCILPNLFLICKMRIKTKKKRARTTLFKDLKDGFKYIILNNKIFYLQLFFGGFLLYDYGVSDVYADLC